MVLELMPLRQGHFFCSGCWTRPKRGGPKKEELVATFSDLSFWRHDVLVPDSSPGDPVVMARAA
jgi:hypothetical protein